MNGEQSRSRFPKTYSPLSRTGSGEAAFRRPALPSTVYAADGMESPAAAAAKGRRRAWRQMRSVLRRLGLAAPHIYMCGCAWRNVGRTHVQVGSPRSDVSDRGPTCQRLSVPDRQKEAHRSELGSAQSRNPRRVVTRRGVARRAEEEECARASSLLKLQ